jgi:hypothetical protein
MKGLDCDQQDPDYDPTETGKKEIKVRRLEKKRRKKMSKKMQLCHPLQTSTSSLIGPPL